MNIYLVDAKRTALGTLGGSLSKVQVGELGAHVVKHMVEKHQIKDEDIDEVITGNVLPATAGQGIGRQVVIKAGLDESIPGYSLNMVCGSGIKTVYSAYTKIKAEEADLIIAGGAENMSLSPYASNQMRSGLRLGDSKLIDTLVYDALTDAYSGVHMGVTAENIAREYNITREEQDKFALESQQKAKKAIEGNYYQEEIIPITVKERRKEVVFDTDEHPNFGTDFEKLGKLRAVFQKDGTVTAGNASGINDGAAYAILANDKMVEKYGFKPMAKVIGFSQVGIDPQVMGLGPAYAIDKLLKKVDMKIEDIDIFELNEAFAAQSIGVFKELVNLTGTDMESLTAKTNLWGGAIALGHPVGASGTRILTTLAHQLKVYDKKYGIASLCIGGGMGIAILIENLK